MNGITLRDYQQDLIDRAGAALATSPRVLIQAPTGAGKTALSAHMVGGAASKGRRILFLVHRQELLRQSSAAFTLQGIPHGTIAAGASFNPYERVHIGSIGTVAKRLAKIPKPDLVVVDEAHHAAAKSWGDVLRGLSPRWIIGLSATPCRLDGRGLGEHFDTIVPGPDVAELIDRGFLSPFRVFAPTTLDLSGVRTTAGDYNRSDVAAAADKPAIIGDAVKHYQRLVPGKRAVVFCCSVQHAEHVVGQFQMAGVAAEHIDGSMASVDRAAALRRFETGHTLVLASVDLVSEGFDLPAIEAAISLRPTKSLSLWLQQVGRVLRPAPGKSEAIVLDHVGNTARHGFPDDPREWTLDGRPKRASKAGQANPVRQCTACYHVHRPAASCPACGHAYAVASRRVDEREGQLAEVERTKARRQMVTDRMREAKSLADFQAIAKEAGYKPGWAWQAWQHSSKNPQRVGRAA